MNNDNKKIICRKREESNRVNRGLDSGLDKQWQQKDHLSKERRIEYDESSVNRVKQESDLQM